MTVTLHGIVTLPQTGESAPELFTTFQQEFMEWCKSRNYKPAMGFSTHPNDTLASHRILTGFQVHTAD